jgi:L-rhamnose mutarotase
LEYHGSNLKRLGKDGWDAKMQEWWAIMQLMQDPLPTRNKGEWWASMEEVFHLE